MLKGYKTYVLALVAIIGAIATYLVGDATLGEALQVIITAVLGATIRKGVTDEAAKTQAKVVLESANTQAAVTEIKDKVEEAKQ